MSEDEALSVIKVALFPGEGNGEKPHIRKAEDETQSSKGLQGIGVESGKYPCIHNHMQGILLAGTNAISFEGRFFFYKHTFLMTWSEITSIQKTDMGLIQVLDQQSTLYEFSGIQHADRVWATLMSLHNESNHDRPFHSPLQTAMKASFRRMSTEPILLHEPRGIPNDEAAYIAAATIAQMDDVLVLSERRVARETSESMMKDGDIATDLEAAWSELYDDTNKNKSYSEVAIKDGDLTCDLDRFYNLFYADDAPHSIQRFMEGNGDKDMVSSKWKEDGLLQLQRTIEYSHPINAPLAPPEARARKEQRYRRFENHGLSIETDTFVDDVPMADCFYVTDRILVEPTARGVRLTVKFDIRFVKTTMFRSIIANTTRREFLKGFQQLYAMMENSIMLLDAETEKRKSLRQSLVRSISSRLSLTPKPEPKMGRRAGEQQVITEGRLFPPFSTLLMLVVIVLQVYILYDIRSMKQAISTLQQGRVTYGTTAERIVVKLVSQPAEEL